MTDIGIGRSLGIAFLPEPTGADVPLLASTGRN
jgi:hypothetical protein